MAWTPRDTSTGNFEDYMYNAVNEYAGGVGQDTSHSNYTLWHDMTDESRENVMNLALSKYQLDMQRKENEAAFMREAEWNSPKNQMARYMEAGLNPNVIYGQIGNGNGNYEAPTVNVPTMHSNRYQKLDKAMDVMNMVAQIVGQGAQLAGQIEGVKNQSLQNQLLEEQMPHIVDKARYEAFREIDKWEELHSYYPKYGDHGELVDPGDPQKVLDLLFPQNASPAMQRSRTYYQNWWNDEIAPLYKSQFEGKSLSAEEQAKIDQYNREQLESFPPIVRPFVWLLTQMFGTVFSAKNTFSPVKAR